MEFSVEKSKENEKQKEYYSEKHTTKIQIIIEERRKKIVFIAFDKGITYNFKLFKDSTIELDRLFHFLADSGH